MSKLSNSILSLKFMQNAQRAKQQKEVEIERAKVKDEAEWEVPKEVREGWGPTSSSSAVSLEDSYLPFLYPVLETAGAEAPIKGRRRYKNGELVKEEIPEVPVPAEEATASTSKAEDPSLQDSSSRKDSSRSGKPRSGLSAPKKKRKDLKAEATDDIPGNAKTVQDLIRENAGIGVDLRGARAAPARAAPSPPVFLKPSGVDEPSKGPAAASSTVKMEQSSDPPPSSKPSKKAKRKSEGDGESVKPKKKKKKEPTA
ncbi:hypothetical protein EV122DRAFT_204175 [Schizophyllum commune]